ncbi:MAG: helix-turn-helix domain-containing protein [Microbacterium sp.]
MFVTQGRADLIVDDDEETVLEAEGVFLVNSGSMFEILPRPAVQMVVLRLDLRRLIENSDDTVFRINSAPSGGAIAVRPLAHLLARIVKLNSSDGEQNRFKTASLIYALLDELTRRHSAMTGEVSAATQKHRERLRALLRYIDDHYAESLTLAKVAQHEHLSGPYLSAFFKEHVGTTFSSYYNALRLERAVDDLVTSDESVESIARRNGFRDPRAFVKLFKERFDVLPSQYRRSEREDRAHRQPRSTVVDHAADTPLGVLAAYLPPGEVPSDDMAVDTVPLTRIVALSAIDASAKGTPLRHTYRRVTTVGRAKELLYEDVRAMLSEWQRDVGFEFVKFHGLFGDDMHVYREDDLGNPVYSFLLVDKVIDYLLSIGLRPFVELSFMPQGLASVPDRTVYSSPFNVSPPRQLERWVDLVNAFLAHVVERYSLDEVASWMFSVWNEPDTGPTLFGFEDDAEFHAFYKATFDTVRRFGKNIRFGSPAMLVTYAQNKDWLQAFLDFADANGCRPDFLTIHFYDNDFAWESLPEHKPGAPSSTRLNRDQDTFHKTLKQLDLLLNDRGLHIPVYMTEWNLTVSHRDLLNDTTFKSCYLAKNLLENYDALESFGYWALTDFMEELQPSADMFHGGLGLLTYNGVKKPHYYFFKSLSRAGERLLASGEGYFICAGTRGLQLYLYNYEHFGHLFASGQRYDMTYLERYAPFSEVGRMDFSVEFTSLPAGRYRLREEIINSEHGSAFDTWIRMGAPAIDAMTVDYIRQVSVPQLVVEDIEISDSGPLTVSAVLEPLEVRVIELVPLG